MLLIIKLAWRNIWRNKRRSFITMAAIMFSALFIVVMRGVQLGTYAKNIRNAVEMFTGYIQIQVVGFKDNPSLRKTFVLTENIKKILDNNPDITGYATRIIADGLIGNEKNSFGTAIFGLDPNIEKKVTHIARRVIRGKFLSNKNKYDIVIGYKLLKNLGSKIGDEIVILSSGYDGSMGNLKFRICGVSKLGDPELDRMSVFMNLSAAKELLSMGNRISTVALSVKGLDKMIRVKEYLLKSLKDIKLPFNRKLTALDWKELMPSLEQSIALDNISGLIFLGLLLIIIAFGILNTVAMSITERFREFGVMIALGTRQIKLVIIVFFETMFIALIGSISGMILGWAINYYIILNPIRFTGGIAKMYEQFGWEPAMFSINTPGIFIGTEISIFIVTIIVFLFPAYKLFKLEALKGIRYT